MTTSLILSAPATSRALQPGDGIQDGTPYLPSAAENVLWGALPCAGDRPVLSIDSGTDVTIDTISHEGILEDQGRDPRTFFGSHGVPEHLVLQDAVELAASDVERLAGGLGPHVVTGPIAVKGARPGDLLKITVLKTTPRVPYGVISSRHGRGSLSGEFPLGPDTYSAFATVRDTDDGTPSGWLPLRPGAEPSVHFPLKPFLGIMGVAVDGGQRPHSVPPGSHGGNIDINLLTAGSTLYLPVQVADALAYVGDPHFAQGDGEVSLTAMEASLRVKLRFDVVPQDEAVRNFGVLHGPMGQTPEFLVPTGMDEDLDTAVQNCVRAAVALLQARYGMDPSLAYAYLSAATDFNISQVVDLVKGVHARIRVEDFRPMTAPSQSVMATAPETADPTVADSTVWREAGNPLLPATGPGPLTGMSVAVKDLFALEGFRIGAGNEEWLGESSPETTTAPAAAALLAAGAVVAGIARTDEFAYSLAGTNAHYGTPPNPKARGRISGGSSSGSASAVSLGQATIGLGTDTGGSIRVPSAYQGLFGIRTTHGAVSTSGLLPLAPSFDTVGWMTRDAATLAAVGNVLLPPHEPTAPLTGAVFAPGLLALAEPDVGHAVEDSLDSWAGSPDLAGLDWARLRTGELPVWLAAFQTVQGYEAWQQYGPWIGGHWGSLGADVAARFRTASRIERLQADDARDVLRAARQHIRAAVGGGLLVLPSASSVAPLLAEASLGGEAIEQVRRATMQLTCIAGIAGLPAVNLPLSTDAGLPCGVSIIGPANRDAELLSLAVRLSGLLPQQRKNANV